MSISRHFSPTFSQGLHGSVLGQCHAWHDHNGKQPHPDIGESVAQLDFPFLLGISATAAAMHLFRARGSLQLQMLLSLSWAGVQVRNAPAHPHVAAPESEIFSECVCVSAPASADGSRQRGCEAANEPRITLEIIGLCTESYLDCSDQSSDEGCGVVPASSLPCATPRQGWRICRVLGPSKAPRKGLKVPRAGAVVGSLGQVPAVSRKALRPGRAPAVTGSKDHIHNLSVPSSSLPSQGLAGCSHDKY